MSGVEERQGKGIEPGVLGCRACTCGGVPTVHAAGGGFLSMDGGHVRPGGRAAGWLAAGQAPRGWLVAVVAEVPRQVD